MMRDQLPLKTIQKERKITGAPRILFTQQQQLTTLHKFSIVIVVKDAAAKIGRLLDSISGLSDDVIVCDTGSRDNTLQVLGRYPVQVYRTQWKGYGRSKNEAISYAKYDWVLSLDSDEKIDKHLYQQLLTWKAPENQATVYQVRWKNFLGFQWIKHSQWGRNWKNRLFHKHTVRWDDAIAHEDVCAKTEISYVKIDGFLEHYSFADKKEYISKMMHSANITALKYHSQERMSSVFHLVACPLFTFFKVILVHLAFLDGKAGWLIAKTTAYYTYLKYSKLRSLNIERDNRKPVAVNYNYQRG